jgi:cytochrome P450
MAKQRGCPIHVTEEENQMLTASEVLSLAIVLLMEGNETTTNLLGNTIVTLLDHPEVLDTVRPNPSLIPQFLEKVLRYRSPVHALYRQTTQAVELAGTTLPAGATVMTLLASANAALSFCAGVALVSAIVSRAA